MRSGAGGRPAGSVAQAGIAGSAVVAPAPAAVASLQLCESARVSPSRVGSVVTPSMPARASATRPCQLSPFVAGPAPQTTSQRLARVRAT